MYVVAGATGRTGRAAAEALLAQGEEVRVIVRSEDKAAPWRARGAEVAIARLDDAAGLGRALDGAKGAYLLLPPDIASDDPIGDKVVMTRAIGEAIGAAKVPHVVFLSSIGAQHERGTGPIRTVAHAERELAKVAGTRFTFLRPAYFLENVESVLGVARAQGVLPATFDPGKRIPMIATVDIGRSAARALVEGPAAGRSGILELAGPRELSFDELAAELTTLLGREVKALHVPRDAVAGALREAGLNAAHAALYAEMAAGIEDGLVDYERAGARFARGSTEPREVLRALVAG